MAELAQGRISNIQLVLLLTGFLLGTSILILPGGDIHPDTWLAFLLGCGQGLILAFIYLALARRFPGQTFVKIAEAVWGRYIGKIVSLAFLWYVFHAGALTTTNFLDFIKVSILPSTPAMLLVLMLVGVCAAAVWSGLEVITRCSEVLVPLTILFTLFLALMLIPDFKAANLQPVLQTPLPELLKTSVRVATFPFGETVIFLMILPFLNKQNKSLSSVVIAFALTVFILITGMLRTLGVLGNVAPLYVYPLYQATRSIDLGHTLTRLEILTSINFLTMGFIKASVQLFAFVVGLSQFLGLKSDRTLVVPAWLLMSLLGLYNLPGVAETIAFTHTVYPFYALPFEVFIPLATLVVAWLRKLPREGQQP
ncbi:MAG TPA: endospore germination permease [Firmicutes bacterium]|jgi:spore germination protein KB|nr:endospore germination permease [Bacillota bacterium]